MVQLMATPGGERAVLTPKMNPVKTPRIDVPVAI